MCGLALSRKLPFRTPTGMFCRLVLLFLAFTLFVALGAPPARAHDIPSDVTVRAFVKPEGQVLRVLIRLPLRTVGGRSRRLAGTVGVMTTTVAG